jgi:hypothetical protein
MQNTDTSANLDNPSSRKEEKPAAPQVMKAVGSLNSPYAIISPRQSLLKKMVHFLCGIFSGKKLVHHKTSSIEITIRPEQKAASVAVITVPLTKTNIPAPALLRKKAEQEFADMDVSQATRN